MNIAVQEHALANRELNCFSNSTVSPAFLPHATDIIHTDNPRLSYVHIRVVEKLSVHLRAQTAECVMATFGISINTWTKMKKGVPIRRSVAERLIERVDQYL